MDISSKPLCHEDLEGLCDLASSAATTGTIDNVSEKLIKFVGYPKIKMQGKTAE